MIEKVEVLGETAEKPEGSEILVSTGLQEGANVRKKGEEAAAGELLMQAGTVLNAAGVGLLATTGNTEVLVYRRPQVAILATGDELVDPGTLPGPGQIRNSNAYSLAAAVKAAGCVPHLFDIVRDNKNEILSAVKKAVAASDMVLLSGGAAGGDFDYTYEVLDELGEVHFCKVNMRPGKAQTFSVIEDTLVFGLAGNPAAALTGFEVLLRPALRFMQGFTSTKRPLTRARLTADVQKIDERRNYLRASMTHDIASGEYSVTPAAKQSSAILSALQQANCLVVLPEGLKGSLKDEIVACLRLDVDEGVAI
jgi:molybdopterin molybdotransferase